MLPVFQETLSAHDNPHDNPHDNREISLQVTPQVKRLLLQLAKHEIPQDRSTLQQALLLKDRKSFQVGYLKPALLHGLIEMTLPDKPTSRLQQYRLSQAGKALVNSWHD
ncbi:Fic family protein [Pseudoalteromonas rubra]|uniref:Fic family protein n=1 Tax=Pseudoalteromonas rubra TaxID=43658 RepID=UPI001F0C0BEE|nr:hypothetical protein [Pseudoalteromonas rubra]